MTDKPLNAYSHLPQGKKSTYHSELVNACDVAYEKNGKQEGSGRICVQIRKLFKSKFERPQGSGHKPLVAVFVCWNDPLERQYEAENAAIAKFLETLPKNETIWIAAHGGREDALLEAWRQDGALIGRSDQFISGAQTSFGGNGFGGPQPQQPAVPAGGHGAATPASPSPQGNGFGAPQPAAAAPPPPVEGGFKESVPRLEAHERRPMAVEWAECYTAALYAKELLRKQHEKNVRASAEIAEIKTQELATTFFIEFGKGGARQTFMPPAAPVSAQQQQPEPLPAQVHQEYGVRRGGNENFAHANAAAAKSPFDRDDDDLPF
jgi:hypothetical protein